MPRAHPTPNLKELGAPPDYEDVAGRRGLDVGIGLLGGAPAQLPAQRISTGERNAHVTVASQRSFTWCQASSRAPACCVGGRAGDCRSRPSNLRPRHAPRSPGGGRARPAPEPAGSCGVGSCTLLVLLVGAARQGAGCQLPCCAPPPTRRLLQARGDTAADTGIKCPNACCCPTSRPWPAGHQVTAGSRRLPAAACLLRGPTGYST